jgi:predicted SAM-dependent methyltransferase
MAFGEAIRALDFLRARGMEHLLDGDLLDIGCGPEPVLPRALGVDLKYGPIKASADASSADLVVDLQTRPLFDAVFSSHCLEHLFSPVSVNLRHFLRFLKPGGFLVLYLPDERYYRFDPENPWKPNPEHLHYMTMEGLEWHLHKLGGVEILHLAPDVDTRHGRYSFLAVVRKL